MKFDVIIIGAGPSGILASSELNKANINHLVLEKGSELNQRDISIPFDVSYGFGGAGLFSDGKLSYPPAATYLWTHLNKNLLKKSYSIMKDLFSKVNVNLKDWENQWDQNGFFEVNELKSYESILLSSEDRNNLLNLIYNDIKNYVLFDHTVVKISQLNGIYEITCSNGDRYSSEILIMATGKSSNLNLFDPQILIRSKFLGEMGVRIQVEKEYFKPMDSSELDYKLIHKLNHLTEIRTFCSCKNGIIRESLFENRSTFNGESTIDDSINSNIGLLLRTQDNKSIFAEEMKSSLENNSKFEIESNGEFPPKTLLGKNIDSCIESNLHHIIRDIPNSSFSLYGPEIERFGYYPVLNKDLLSNENLFFTGDCTGQFRGLMAAFLSGIYVVRVITKNKLLFKLDIKDKLNIKKSSTNEIVPIFTAQSKAYFYCKDTICQYVFENGYLPINPFMVFDYFLNDRVDRNLIRRGNNQLIKMCHELWVFGPISDGVLFEISLAIEQEKKIRFFSIATKTKEIKELNINEINFEPEVHAKQIKKADLIRFIESKDSYQFLTEFEQLTYLE